MMQLIYVLRILLVKKGFIFLGQYCVKTATVGRLHTFRARPFQFALCCSVVLRQLYNLQISFVSFRLLNHDFAMAEGHLFLGCAQMWGSLISLRFSSLFFGFVCHLVNIAVVKQFLGCRAVIRLSSGSCQRVVRKSSGSYQKSSRSKQAKLQSRRQTVRQCQAVVRQH